MMEWKRIQEPSIASDGVLSYPYYHKFELNSSHYLLNKMLDLCRVRDHDNNDTLGTKSAVSSSFHYLGSGRNDYQFSLYIQRKDNPSPVKQAPPPIKYRPIRSVMKATTFIRRLS
uniref:Uncharacterized protein n=1 Tax=Glossina pallidipes TaxID=7398 RepID=A0A1A9ZNN0_GLOPL